MDWSQDLISYKCLTHTIDHLPATTTQLFSHIVIRGGPISFMYFQCVCVYSFLVLSTAMVVRHVSASVHKVHASCYMSKTIQVKLMLVFAMPGFKGSEKPCVRTCVTSPCGILNCNCKAHASSYISKT